MPSSSTAIDTCEVHGCGLVQVWENGLLRYRYCPVCKGEEYAPKTVSPVFEVTPQVLPDNSPINLRFFPFDGAITWPWV